MYYAVYSNIGKLTMIIFNYLVLPKNKKWCIKMLKHKLSNSIINKLKCEIQGGFLNGTQY